jgi:TonB family protein
MAQDEAIPDVLKSGISPDLDYDYRGEADTFEALIDSVSEEYGTFAPELIEPLLQLSHTYVQMGDVEQAHEALNRAQHITHRNGGVYSPTQRDILQRKTRLSLQSDDPLEANKQQEFLFFVNTHNFEDLELLPAYLDIAKWYIETGQYYRSRKILQEAITLIEESVGENDLRMLEPLQLIAKSRRLQGVCCSEKYLSRILDVIESSSDVPADTIAMAYAGLADAYTISGKFDEAASFYSMASQYMSTDQHQGPQMIAMSKQLDRNRIDHMKIFRPNKDMLNRYRYHPLNRRSLEEQLALSSQPPQRFVLPLNENTYNVKIRDSLESAENSDQSERLVGNPFQFLFKHLKTVLPHSLYDGAKLANVFISLEFTVTRTGTIQDIELAESNAPIKLNRLMKQVMKKTRYRPALVDGQPVIKHKVTLTQSFAPN